MNYKKIEGGVTAPKGYVTGAVYTAIKVRKNEKPDVAVLYSEQPAACAACFTKNKFCAAPVILGREILKKGKARAVVINSGNAITATSHIRMEKDGQVLDGLAVGDGPVDASFLAIEQIVGRHFELDDLQVHAVTEGREAMGETIVRLRGANGRLFSGRGISTDIIGSSIRAYVSAVNKIIYEEGNV